MEISFKINRIQAHIGKPTTLFKFQLHKIVNLLIIYEYKNDDNYFIYSQVSSMWNLKDSNVRVGLFMKTQAFKKHINNLKNTKSTFNFQHRPWRPTFKLSRNESRYHKNKNKQVQNENTHLIRRIAQIDQNPKINTLMQVPHYVPSNKQNYQQFKNRERSNKSRQVSSQNQKIFSRIATASKSYNRQKLQKDWQQNQRLKRNISKKQKCHDFRQLAERNNNNNSQLTYSINLARRTQAPNHGPKQSMTFDENFRTNRSQLCFNRYKDKFKRVR